MARDDAPTLRITPLARIRHQDRDAIADEGERLLAFLAADAAPRRVEIVPL